MKILMTGASSFTGFWFAKALTDNGHSVSATFTKSQSSYEGLRRERIDLLCAAGIHPIWNCLFGSDQFIALLQDGYDVVCHHGAYVENYKSPSFDVARAVAENTRQCDRFVAVAREQGVQKIIVTGSVFEANEGTGSLPLVAFSPYGLSKTFSWELFRYWAWRHEMPVLKFVIPNPFGPFEEPRFCNFLIQNWVKGNTPQVKTPDYIRDNIHIDLLAACYMAAVLGKTDGILQVNPSGYVGSQKDFALRFAAEIGPRLGIPHKIEFATQEDFSEPMERVNTNPAGQMVGTWNETRAWDGLAAYYEQFISVSK